LIVTATPDGAAVADALGSAELVAAGIVLVGVGIVSVLVAHAERVTISVVAPVIARTVANREALNDMRVFSPTFAQRFETDRRR
jgi:hypothetical protein